MKKLLTTAFAAVFMVVCFAGCASSHQESYEGISFEVPNNWEDISDEAQKSDVMDAYYCYTFDNGGAEITFTDPSKLYFTLDDRAETSAEVLNANGEDRYSFQRVDSDTKDGYTYDYAKETFETNKGTRYAMVYRVEAPGKPVALFSVYSYDDFPRDEIWAIQDSIKVSNK